MRWIKGNAALAAATAFLLCGGIFSATAVEFSPEEIKASYILKMRPYISVGVPERVPKSFCYFEKPGAPSEQSVGQIMAKSAKKSSSSANVSVKRIDDVPDAKGCDVLFIPDGERASMARLLAHLDASSTLTISDMKRFIFQGGMIGFVFSEDNRVRMEANILNMHEKDVKIGAKILELMQQVVTQ